MTDIDSAIEFYERLGFQASRYDDGYAWIRHCGWEWFHLRRVDSVRGNCASAYLHVDDADAWRKAMIESATDTIEIAEATDTPWAKREFSVTDPDGNLIRIGSNL